MADYALAKTGKLKLKGEKDNRYVHAIQLQSAFVLILYSVLRRLLQKEEEEAQEGRGRRFREGKAAGYIETWCEFCTVPLSIQ